MKGKRKVVFEEDGVSSESCCVHGGYTVIYGRNGEIKLRCCEKSVVCKRQELKRLSLLAEKEIMARQELSENIEQYRIDLNLERNKSRDLKERLIAAEAKVSSLEKELERKPGTINNIQYHDNRQVNITANIIGKEAHGILLDGLKNINVYESAFRRLNSLPPSEERNRLLALAQSSDISDVLNFKREVVEILEDELPGFEADETTKNGIKKSLQDMNDQISAEARNNDIEKLAMD